MALRGCPCLGLDRAATQQKRLAWRCATSVELQNAARRQWPVRHATSQLFGQAPSC